MFNGPPPVPDAPSVAGSEPPPVLQRVAAGERAAVESCLDRYGGLIWSLARRLAPRPADVEDAVQEIFLEVWKHAGRFDPQRGSEKTFIATLARRRLLDRRRKAGRRPELRPLPAPVEGEESPILAEADHLRMEHSADAALAARRLRLLSSEQQRVIELVIHQGMTHREVAEIIDMPLGTVKSHLRRGLAAVRRDLTGDERAAL